MKKIALINCTPEIVSKSGAEITLRFPEGEEERMAFEEAIRKTKLTPAEFTAEYLRECGTDPSQVRME
jgi:hypothetical protein